MQLRMVFTLAVVVTFSMCAALLCVKGSARPADFKQVPPHAQQLARMISAYEVLEAHFAIMEEDADVRSLIAETCDATLENADVGVTWSYRHFDLELRPKQELSDFEQLATRRLQAESEGPREFWSEDHTRYVRAVVANTANCVRCHDPGDDKQIGFVSIEFKEPSW